MILRLDELTQQETSEYLEKKQAIAIPFGTLEAHGRHLPMGTDGFCAQAFSDKIAERFSIMSAPVLSYGVTNGLFRYKGASTFKKETYNNFVLELLESFIEAGFREFVLVNGHGGNVEALNWAALNIMKDKNARVIVVHWWDAVDDAVAAVYEGKGGHAACEETAVILAYRPELVKKEKYDDISCYSPKKGIVAYPHPGTVLLYDEKSIKPDFDEKKAEIFMEKAVEFLFERISEAFEAWKRM